MTFEIPNLAPASAEIFILATACLSIVCELFFVRRFKHIAYYVVQLGLIVAFVLSSFQLGEYRTLTFNGLFVADDVATLLKSFIYIIAFLSFLYSRHYLEDRKIPQGEFYILGLFSTLGMMVLVSAHSMLTVYLGLELMSLPLYAMVALRRDCGVASEAAMKYFVMGAIASGMLLYGMSLLYGATGSIDLSDVASRLPQVLKTQQLLVSFSLVFIVVGICFKLAVVPFHMWAPDVYQGSPSAVTIFISSAPKLAALGMAFRLLVFGMPFVQNEWQQLFVVVSLLSVILGNLFAIAQRNIKRMLAYSGIAHMGYVLFGFIAGTQEGYAASLFYVLIYGLMSVAAFGLVVIMSRLGFEAENIEDFKGLNARSPWLAFMMLMVMLSMAGVPPLVGFFSKLMVLKALVTSGFVWLAVVGMLFAVVGAYYYIRIIKVMYFEEPDIDTSAPVVVASELKLSFSVNAFSLLVLGLLPNALMYACISAFSN